MIPLRPVLVLVGIGFLLVPLARSQTQPKGAKAVPKLEAVAETHLLMEGMLQPNFRAAEKILRGVPADAESWTFARGQALLMAEAGNLLMLRPPKNQGADAWMNRSGELREAASRLSRLAAAKDTVRSRVALVEIADVCNRCHESFRVQSKITVFAEEGK